MSTGLRAACAAAGGQIACGAHVVALHAAPDGRARAATVRRPDGREERIACRARVAATCGGGASRERVRAFVPEVGRSPVHRRHGLEGNDGAGMRRGRALGGCGSMDGFQGCGAPAHREAALLTCDVFMEGGVQVTVRGERIGDERADLSGQGQRGPAQPEAIVWALFDAAREARVQDRIEYRDLRRLGAATAAADVAEVAARIGCAEDALAETPAEAAAAARGEAPDPFGRDFRGAAPRAPPYRRVRITGALFHTQGGWQLDAEARGRTGAGCPTSSRPGGRRRGCRGTGRRAVGRRRGGDAGAHRGAAGGGGVSRQSLEEITPVAMPPMRSSPKRR